MRCGVWIIGILFSMQLAYGMNQLSAPGGMDEPDECPVCFEDLILNSDENKVVTTACKHIFHELCLEEWRQQNIEKPTCPYCREPLKLQKITQTGGFGWLSYAAGFFCTCVHPKYE